MSKIDPVLILLLGAVVFFTLVLIYCSHMFANNNVLLNSIDGLITAFSGAFIMRVNPKASSQDTVEKKLGDGK